MTILIVIPVLCKIESFNPCSDHVQQSVDKVNASSAIRAQSIVQ